MLVKERSTGDKVMQVQVAYLSLVARYFGKHYRNHHAFGLLLLHAAFGSVAVCPYDRNLQPHASY